MRRGWLTCADCKERFHFFYEGKPIYEVYEADLDSGWSAEWFQSLNLCAFCGFAEALEAWAEYRLKISPKRT